MIPNHTFSEVIVTILQRDFDDLADEIFEKSPLLQYINIKTRSASRGSKSRASFANLYAIYILVEDYVSHNFHEHDSYTQYEGAKYSDLLARQRELPFGQKLQNHALNHRLNQEFRKYFPQSDYAPIMRDSETKRYWINEQLLKVTIANKTYNISLSIIAIVDAYIIAKRTSLELFLADCERLQQAENQAGNEDEVLAFIKGLLRPNVDARIFEIVSFAILKHYYADIKIYWGWKRDDIREDLLTLFKTGRTNANDGGIDFVMRPLGRFFQVTETTDVRKFFLDIDKVQKYPITFVVKSKNPVEDLLNAMESQAKNLYTVQHIVDKYMQSIETIINIPILADYINQVRDKNRLDAVLNDIILHSKTEFNQ